MSFCFHFHNKVLIHTALSRICKWFLYHLTESKPEQGEGAHGIDYLQLFLSNRDWLSKYLFSLQTLQTKLKTKKRAGQNWVLIPLDFY